MSIELKQTDKAFVPEGLADGGHHVLVCYNCRARLMDLWVNRPHETDEYAVRAGNCPWCDADERTRGKGGSYPVVFRGGFYPGGVGCPKDDATEETLDDEWPSTAYDDYEIVDGIVVFHVIANGKGARPSHE